MDAVEKQYLKSCIFSIYIVSSSARQVVFLDILGNKILNIIFILRLGFCRMRIILKSEHLSRTERKKVISCQTQTYSTQPSFFVPHIPIPKNSIIEAFTISFYYSPIAGTELLMPQVEISDLTNGLSINEKSTVGDLTVGEVKRSLRVSSHYSAFIPPGSSVATKADD